MENKSIVEKLKVDFLKYLDSLQTEVVLDTVKPVLEHEDFRQSRATNYIAFGLHRYYKLLSNLKGGYIAGGVFKNLFEKKPGRDLDIFFETQEAYKKAVQLMDATKGYVFHYENDNCKAYKHIKHKTVVELVKTRFLPAAEMIDLFDFTIVKAALQYRDDGNVIFTYHKDFFEHLMTKKLVLVKEPHLPVHTLQRSWKYAGYGYGLCRESKALLTKCVIERGDITNLSKELYFGLD